MRISEIPTPIARRIVPLKPARWQRFQGVRSWSEAEQQTVGYPLAPVQPSGIVPAGGKVASGNSTALLAAIGCALAYLGIQDTVSVADFGGGSGTHYRVSKSHFPSVHFRWTVVELPSVVAQQKTFGIPEVRYADSLESLSDDRFDVGLASASINYVRDPLKVVHSLLSMCRVLVVTRVPIWPISSHTAAIQRVANKPIEISYPTWFFSEESLEKELFSKNVLLLRFICPGDRAYFLGNYAEYQGFVLTPGQGVTEFSRNR